jgi:hypothetical protein
MAEGRKYVAINFDQEYFIDELLPRWSTNNALDESIYIIARFVTHDPASNATVYDELTIEIKGSGEPFSIYCDWNSLSVANSQHDVTYDISSPSKAPAPRRSYDFDSALATGEVSEKCLNLTSTSIDFLLPDGTVWTLWNEGDVYDANADSGFWIRTEVDSTGNEYK